MELKPLIYVCSPLRGDVERNINRAIGYSRFVYADGKIPITPHIIFTQFLDEQDADERKAGMKMGLQLLRKCQELWSFGDRLSEGMVAEIAAAKTLGITVKRFDSKCELLEVDYGHGEQE